MRDLLMITGVTLVAIVLGVFLFLYGPDNLTTTPLQTTTRLSISAPVPFRELARGAQSTETRRVNYLITSTADLARLWKMTDAKGHIPAVDFNTDVVIAVFAGKKPTAGYAIAVTGVTDDTARMVAVTLTSPDSTCLLAQSVTTPYQIIELPKTTLPLEHEDISTTTNCLR